MAYSIQFRYHTQAIWTVADSTHKKPEVLAAIKNLKVKYPDLSLRVLDRCTNNLVPTP
jgi:DNA-binding transcriptional regulator WhiA